MLLSLATKYVLPHLVGTETPKTSKRILLFYRPDDDRTNNPMHSRRYAKDLRRSLTQVRFGRVDELVFVLFLLVPGKHYRRQTVPGGHRGRRDLRQFERRIAKEIPAARFEHRFFMIDEGEGVVGAGRYNPELILQCDVATVVLDAPTLAEILAITAAHDFVASPAFADVKSILNAISNGINIVGVAQPNVFAGENTFGLFIKTVITFLALARLGAVLPPPADAGQETDATAAAKATTTTIPATLPADLVAANMVAVNAVPLTPGIGDKLSAALTSAQLATYTF